MEKTSRSETGQGLVEYALILVLVCVVVIAILMRLGPAVGDIFSDVVVYLQGSGVITSVSAARTGGGSNAVKVTITVSTNTNVSVYDSQNADPVVGVPCNGSCTVTLGGVGDGSGTARVVAEAGGMATASYPAKP